MKNTIIVPDSIADLTYSVMNDTWMDIRFLTETKMYSYRIAAITIQGIPKVIRLFGADSGLVTFPTIEGGTEIRVTRNVVECVYKIEIETGMDEKES